MSPHQRITRIYIRFVGGMMLLALPFVFVPHEWMVAINASMGLVELPDTPIVRYLTRSTSALYAMNGALLVYLSFHVEPYRPVLRFLAGAGIAFGALMIGVDIQAGLPTHWVWREGPVVILESGILLALLGRKRLHQPSTRGGLSAHES